MINDILSPLIVYKLSNVIEFYVKQNIKNIDRYILLDKGFLKGT